MVNKLGYLGVKIGVELAHFAEIFFYFFYFIYLEGCMKQKKYGPSRLLWSRAHANIATFWEEAMPSNFVILEQRSGNDPWQKML